MSKYHREGLGQDENRVDQHRREDLVRNFEIIRVNKQFEFRSQKMILRPILSKNNQKSTLEIKNQSKNCIEDFNFLFDRGRHQGIRVVDHGSCRGVLHLMKLNEKN